MKKQSLRENAVSASLRERLTASAWEIENRNDLELKQLAQTVRRKLFKSVPIEDLEYALRVSFDPDVIATANSEHLDEIEARLSRFDFDAQREPLDDQLIERAGRILAAVIDRTATLAPAQED